ncbi:hypothetical protein NDU88_005391 [Pleurodeles waltl]|uniref:Uncharacterized protein n=1 Tax=Pleurodeles waltl TaxID=8319 RepID=A0AAV7L9C0_PLEWA|nr:hypothetical protein NDU88_005391 [Pleurodeles waltl]
MPRPPRSPQSVTPISADSLALGRRRFWDVLWFREKQPRLNLVRRRVLPAAPPRRPRKHWRRAHGRALHPPPPYPGG